MKCVRCRTRFQVKKRLCRDCYQQNSTLSVKEEAISGLYEDAPMKNIALETMGYSPGEEEKFIDEYIEHMDDEGNIQDGWMFERNIQRKAEFLEQQMGPDYMHQMKREAINFVGDEEFFGEEIPPHPEVDPYCHRCRKPKYSLCNHLSQKERMKILYRLERYDNLLELINEVSDDKELQTTAKLYNARMLLATERYNDAMELTYTLQDQVDNDSILELKTLVIIGSAHVKQKNEQASEYIARIGEKLVRLHSDDKRANQIIPWENFMMMNLGQLYLETNQPHKAGETFTRVLKQYFEIGDKFGMGKASRAVAKALIFEGKIDEGIAAIEFAIRIFEDLKIKHEIGRSELVKAKIAIQNEDLEKTKKIFLRAQQHFQQDASRFKNELLGIYATNAQLMISDGEILVGKQLLSKAIDIGTEKEEIDKIISGISAGALIVLKNNDIDSAQEDIKITKNMLNELLDPTQAEEIISQLDQLDTIFGIFGAK